MKKKTVQSILLHGTQNIIPQDRTCGPVSPVASIEPVVVQFSKWKQESNQPMKPSESINFARSFIEGSTIVQKGESIRPLPVQNKLGN